MGEIRRGRRRKCPSHVVDVSIEVTPTSTRGRSRQRRNAPILSASVTSSPAPPAM
jgi:hypothetical protein